MPERVREGRERERERERKVYGETVYSFWGPECIGVGPGNLYYYSEVCVCVCVCVCVSVCLCRFYLKTVNFNDLILFATWRHSSSSGFKILTKFL